MSLSKLTITLVTTGQHHIGECKNEHPYSSKKIYTTATTKKK